MNHPLQAQLWTVLDRVQVRKAWALDLNVADSEISRWASGTRAMSLDDLVACVRVCRRVGNELIALRVVALLVSEVDPGRSDPGPPVNAFEASMRGAEVGGDAARTMREVLADGRIDIAEAVRVDEIADRYEQLAAQFRRIAADARKTTTPGGRTP